MLYKSLFETTQINRVVMRPIKFHVIKQLVWESGKYFDFLSFAKKEK